MANPNTLNEQNNESDDEENSFFESLDRIPSLLSSPTKQDFRVSFSSAFESPIWMRDPVSLAESRRRLLHEMVAPPKPVSFARSLSDSGMPFQSPEFLRSFSSPPSPWLGGDRGIKGDVFIEKAEESGGACKIRNLDTGKEFLVSEDGKEGTCGRLNDLQTGLQLTIEEFERFLGFSPIVNELMRRVSFGGEKKSNSGSSKSGVRKRGSWLKNIKFVASSVTSFISDKERNAGGKSSSLNGKSMDWLKVNQHGKTFKDLTGLYMCQEIKAHQGSIWCMRFSFDGKFLASAGEDRTVHVWRVMESEILSTSCRMEQDGILGSRALKKMRKKRKLGNRKRFVPDCVVLPDTIFSISETPFCSFEGHLDDVLDLSWSKSQRLLSSSMDKTVRLWDMETRACLKLFAHNDYVTCIQFNPIDENHFISGSLDGIVRIWSIPKRQVVAWTDFNEMVTAVCYTPNGQGALVGSHKGSFRCYNISDKKLSQESQIDISNKKKKLQAKKITGFQYSPDNPSQVLVTSADSQIRLFDGVDMIHKFRDFRNTSSQLSASFSSDGKYIVCSSEDSHVYIWKRGMPRSAGSTRKNKTWVTTRSHEHFYCKDVSVAIPWPNNGNNCDKPTLPNRSKQSTYSLDDLFRSTDSVQASSSHTASGLKNSSSLRSLCSVNLASSSSSFASWGRGGGSNKIGTSSMESSNAWGLAVVTAGLGGNIRIYQNFGFPVRLSRQNNLF